MFGRSALVKGPGGKGGRKGDDKKKMGKGKRSDKWVEYRDPTTFATSEVGRYIGGKNLIIGVSDRTDARIFSYQYTPLFLIY